jgi:hypothetical protein
VRRHAGRRIAPHVLEAGVVVQFQKGRGECSDFCCAGCEFTIDFIGCQNIHG